jgi:glycoside/pentoside/hexuronide:cation symporter, GPH family
MKRLSPGALRTAAPGRLAGNRKPAEKLGAAPDKLPLSLCLGFGVGSLGISILLNTVTTFFPALMTTVLGQSAALAGLLLTVSKLYDVVADIVIGTVSDRTQSRLGRRRPYLLAGAIVSALSFVLIFAPPKIEGTALILYMLVALVVYSTGYSLFSVPYVAMSGEMTDGYHERTRLLSYRAFFIAIGQTLSAAGTAALITWAGGGSHGYTVMGLTTGAIMTASLAASFFGTARARCVHVQHSAPFGSREALRTLVSSRPFVLLMCVKLTQYMAIAIVNTTKLLFLLNVLHVGYAGLVLLALVQNIVSAVSLPGWVRLARRIGKKRTHMIAIVTLAAVYASWFWTGPGITSAGIWVRGAINGVAAAGVMLMSNSMLPDVMEYDRLRTGRRREGVFSGIYTILEKVAYAIGAGVVGLLLAAFGYIPTLQGQLVQQPGSAITALYAGASIIPTALVLVSCALMLRYELDERVLHEAAGTIPAKPNGGMARCARAASVVK